MRIFVGLGRILLYVSNTKRKDVTRFIQYFANILKP